MICTEDMVGAPEVPAPLSTPLRPMSMQTNPVLKQFFNKTRQG